MPSAPPQGSSAQPSVVLLLQDDTLELYDWVLTRDGFTTHATTDPTEALRAAADADVIVTALKLRGSFDGIELVRRLRADDRTRNRTVVVLSASVTPTCRQQAIDAGCDLFVPKPCLPDELVEVLRRAVRPNEDAAPGEHSTPNADRDAERARAAPATQRRPSPPALAGSSRGHPACRMQDEGCRSRPVFYIRHPPSCIQSAFFCSAHISVRPPRRRSRAVRGRGRRDGPAGAPARPTPSALRGVPASSPRFSCIARQDSCCPWRWASSTANSLDKAVIVSWLCPFDNSGPTRDFGPRSFSMPRIV